MRKNLQDLTLAVAIVIVIVCALVGGLVGADLARYTAAVIIDGDTLNDWLTHMPSFLRYPALVWGELVWAVMQWLG